MGVARKVRIAEGNVQGIVGHRRCICGQVGFHMRALVHAKTEVMPP